MNVLTQDKYDSNLNCNVDQGEAASRGFMWKSTDWKNVQMHGYFKFMASGSDRRMSLYCRSGEHSGTNCCTGSKYTWAIYSNGRSRFGKEMYHNDYAPYKNEKNLGLGSLVGKWVGFAFIVYNISVGNKIGVKMEAWLDKNADNNWIKFDELTDSGGWGDTGRRCGGTADQIFSYGAPYATFRADELGTPIRWRKLAVIPINPTGQTPAPEPIPDPTEISFTTTFLYNLGQTTVPTCEQVITDPDPPPPPPPAGKTTYTKDIAGGQSLL